jgi:Aminotransferase class-V
MSPPRRHTLEFPLAATGWEGCDVQQVAFRNGRLEPEDVSAGADVGTRLVAFSCVQSAPGHRSDIAAIRSLASDVGAVVFVDGTQMVGAARQAVTSSALTCSRRPTKVPAQRGPRHRLLLPVTRPRNGAWRRSARAGRGARSRWRASLAAIGNETALTVFCKFGPGTLYDRNCELTARLRGALAGAGWNPVDLPELNQSTIVSVPLGGRPASQRAVQPGNRVHRTRWQSAPVRPFLQPRR